MALKLRWDIPGTYTNNLKVTIARNTCLHLVAFSGVVERRYRCHVSSRLSETDLPYLRNAFSDIAAFYARDTVYPIAEQQTR
jgi:hypothetical protein